MRTSKKWYFLLLILAISCSSKYQEQGIPILSLSCSDSPFLKVHIEDIEYTFELDLGSNSYLMLKQRVLDQIQDKKLDDVSIWYDIQGNEYHSSTYRIPLFKFGNLRFENGTVTEENEFFLTTGSKVRGVSQNRIENQLRSIDGRLGCPVFHSAICYFDLSHSFFLCELNMEDMKKRISLEDFIEAPFDFENGLVCVDFITENGIKKFILDTGANISIGKKGSFFGEGSKSKVKHLQLSSEDLGKWSLYLLDFPEKLAWMDGALGMDFFKKFAICLDFPNKKIYLKRSRSNFFIH